MSSPSIEQFKSTYFPDTVILLGHGRWGSGQQLQPLRDYLEPHVHAVLTPDLPIEEPGLSYEDYADYIAVEVLKNHENVEYWSHSRGSETAVRVALRRIGQIARLGYFCPRIPRAKGQQIPEGRPSRIMAGYALLEKKLGEQLADEHFPEFRSTLCSQSSDEEAAFIKSTLRRQAALKPAPEIEKQPNVPIDVVITTEDGVRNPNGVIADSRAYPGVEPIQMRGDHYPHVNQAEFLGALILSRIGQPPFRYSDPKALAPDRALGSPT